MADNVLGENYMYVLSDKSLKKKETAQCLKLYRHPHVLSSSVFRSRGDASLFFKPSHSELSSYNEQVSACNEKLSSYKDTVSAYNEEVSA